MKTVILDCDPGLDDAVAILLAAGSPELDIAAITTVAGNQTLEKVTRNALGLAALAGLRDVPVAAGAARPLVRPGITAPDIHGENGIGGVELPPPSTALDPRGAVRLIIDTVMSHAPGEVTLVPTGALTNIALAARLAPAIVDRVAEVVLMGGGARHGNRTASAEFNVFDDPEAAHIVFNEPWPVTMVGLDATHQAVATAEVQAEIAALGTAPARAVASMLGFYGRAYAETQGLPFPPVHDPVAVARVIDPSLVTVHRAPIDVELAGALTTGATVVDWRVRPDESCHTQLAVDVDVAGFWRLVVEALRKLG